MKVLVLNCGSSSLKFQLIEPGTGGSPPGGPDRRWARGLVDRVGGEATCTFSWAGEPSYRETAFIANHEEAVEKVLAWLGTSRPFDAVGHRVVHGGGCFTAPELIGEEVLAAIEAFSDLAPLHNPASLSGIRAARRLLGPGVPMVAVFDTAFHHTLPDYASLYAIPYELSLRHKVRRYGFHGLAHQSVVLRYAEITRRPLDRVKLVTLHLGNGCSASAVCGGKSVDTSMGFTPLEGLVMGSRSGDLDPSLVNYLARKEGVSAAEVELWLSRRSGLLGVSGRSRDMRELLHYAPEDPRCRLAVELFCYRARKYLGAYLAVLGGAEAVVFSGGIGEHAPEVRAKICEGMEWCGLELDPRLNAFLVGKEGSISPPQARISAYVIPADEEILIARATARVLAGTALPG